LSVDMCVFLYVVSVIGSVCFLFKLKTAYDVGTGDCISVVLSVYNHRVEGWQQHMYELSILV